MTGVRLEWAQFGDFDYFSVYRQTFLPFDLENLPPLRITNLKTMYCVDADVVLETTYHYLVATHRDTEIEYSEIGSVFVTFDPPYDVTGVWNGATEALDLTWEFDW